MRWSPDGKIEDLGSSALSCSNHTKGQSGREKVGSESEVNGKDTQRNEEMEKEQNFLTSDGFQLSPSSFFWKTLPLYYVNISILSLR